MTQKQNIVEHIQHMKKILSQEDYESFTNNINSLQIMHPELSMDEFYSEYSEYSHFVLYVSRRNKDTFAVVDSFNRVYSTAKQKFIHESLPSNRTDEFIASTRFTLEEACDLVVQLILTVKVGRYSFEEVRQHTQEGNETER